MPASSSATALLASQHLCHCGIPAVASPRRPGQQYLCHCGALASNIFPIALRCSAPAGSPLCRRFPACNSSAAAPLPAVSLPLRCPSQQHLPDRSSLQRPGQQHLPDGSSLQRPCRQSSVPTVPCLQQLRRSAPPSNKPHSAEKSTPVWLAIWRTWAGFANSQLLPDAAAFSSMQGLPRSGNSSAQTSASLHPPAALRLRCLPFTRDMGVHGLCGRVPDSAGNVSPWIESAQTDANLSAHLHRLPTPPAYLRRMRLLPGLVRRCWMQDEAVA